MSADATTEKESIRAWIRQEIARVPHSVINGSHQDAVRFKKFHADTVKIIESSKTTVESLRGLRVRVANLYRGQST